jgi:hypothetical protein
MAKSAAAKVEKKVERAHTKQITEVDLERVKHVQNVSDLPLTEEVFAKSFEVYIDCKEQIDHLEARQESVKPTIAAYVKQHGQHEKPHVPDDAVLDYNGYRVYNQWNPRWHDEHGVAWIKAEMQKLEGKDDEMSRQQRGELERLLVPTFVLNRPLWEAMRDRPQSPIPVAVRDAVIPVSFKVYARWMAKQTCACGATVHNTFKFCPQCGKPTAEQFDNAHKAK